MTTERRTETVTIFDTTLRDGEQAPGFSLRPKEKLRLAHRLDELGVDVIEAGFPIASESDFEAVRAVARDVRRPAVTALARCATGDIERAGAALEGAARPRLHVFIATSELHMTHKLRMTRAQVLAAAAAGVRQARRFAGDVEFSAEDATRSDREFLADVVGAVIDAGATTVNLPDTVGYATPSEVTEFFRDMRSRVDGADRATFSFHGHDDLGLAVANSLAAIEGGARQVECTVNGIGERAGNASLEEIVMALRVRADRLPYATGVDSAKLFGASQLLSELTGEKVQANKAIVGRNAFAHEAGIHQDGILKDRRTYEIMRAEDVGAPRATLVLGKHSGRHALAARCGELGMTPDRFELDDLYRRMIHRADAGRPIRDADLSLLLAEVRRAAATAARAQAPSGPTSVARSEAGLAADEAGYGHGV